TPSSAALQFMLNLFDFSTFASLETASESAEQIDRLHAGNGLQLDLHISERAHSLEHLFEVPSDLTNLITLGQGLHKFQYGYKTSRADTQIMDRFFRRLGTRFLPGCRKFLPGIIK